MKFAKVKFAKFRDFGDSRKFLPAKVSAFKVVETDQIKTAQLVDWQLLERRQILIQERVIWCKFWKLRGLKKIRNTILSDLFISYDFAP